MMTLRETLDLVPDFRSSQGRRHSLGAILALATPEVRHQIQRFSQSHHPPLPLKLVIILYYFDKMKRPWPWPWVG